MDEVEVISSEQSVKRRYTYTYDEEYGERLRSYGVIYAEKNSVKVMWHGGIFATAILDPDMPEEQVRKIIYDEIARYKDSEQEKIDRYQYEHFDELFI